MLISKFQLMAGANFTNSLNRRTGVKRLPQQAWREAVDARPVPAFPALPAFRPKFITAMPDRLRQFQESHLRGVAYITLHTV
jgi:hypothetical protein